MKTFDFAPFFSQRELWCCFVWFNRQWTLLDPIYELCLLGSSSTHSSILMFLTGLVAVCPRVRQILGMSIYTKIVIPIPLSCFTFYVILPSFFSSCAASNFVLCVFSPERLWDFSQSFSHLAQCWLQLVFRPKALRNGILTLCYFLPLGDNFPPEPACFCSHSNPLGNFVVIVCFVFIFIFRVYCYYQWKDQQSRDLLSQTKSRLPNDTVSKNLFYDFFPTT